MQRVNYVILALLMLSLSSCELIGDIFEVGVWVGILMVAAVIGLVIWLISRFMK